MISMRRLTVFAAALLGTLPAFAADMAEPPPILRGALPVETGIDWSGFYLGGTGSYNAMSLNRNQGQGSTDELLQRLVLGTVVQSGINAMPLVEQGTFRTNRMGLGAFMGYNWTTEGAVFGIELDYTRTQINNDVNGARSGMVTGGTPQTTFEWDASTQKRSKLTDIGTIRARMGYAYGNFLPFVTAGLALGRSAETASANISGRQWPTASGGSCAAAGILCGPTAYNPSSLSEGNRAKLQTGYVVGMGFDYAFSSNIFVRAEVQHMRFSDIANSSAQLNQARVGAGLKF